MSLFCSISGAVPEEPCASKKSGHVFERRLAEKYVAETGRCPATGQPLGADDLLRLAPAAATGAAAPPRPAPAASVPGLISLLRDEWDASALEAHALRAQLHSARQELAHALYQHDAACRVIARLLRERDEARAALEVGGAPRGVGGAAAAAAAAAPALNGQKRARPDEQAAAAAAAEPSAGEAQAAPAPPPPQALPAEVAADVAAVSAELSRARRGRAPPASLAPAEQVARFAASAAHPLHGTRPAGGILSVACLGDLVATGGADGAVGLLDLATGRVAAGAPLKAAGGGKKVAAVAFASAACVLSASPAERALRVWRVPDDGADGEGWTCAHTLTAAGDGDNGKGGKGGGKDGGGGASAALLVGVAAHPSGRYAVSATADGGWRTWELASGALLRAVAPPPDAAAGSTCAAIALHPDGLIVATCQGATVVLWELASGACAASLPPATAAAAAGGGGGGGGSGGGGGDPAATCLAFSENGYHLAVGGSDGRVRLWDLRKVRCVRTIEAFSSPALSAAVGEGGGGGDKSGGGGEKSGGGGGDKSGGAPSGPVASVAFDHSGSYLAAAGREAGVKVYSTGKAEWRELASWPAAAVAKKAAAGVAWAPGARALLVAGSDHNLRVLEAPAAE